MAFWEDLVGAFTGSTARKDINKGKVAATGALNAGKEEGLGYYEQAAQGQQPFIEGGNAAYKRYLDLAGVNGLEAQKAAEADYFADPAQNMLMERIQRGNNRSFGAVGMGNSGKATQSLTNALLERLGSYRQELATAGGQGERAAATQGGFRAGQGDIAFGTGQQIAGVNIGAANANAASRAAPINNLLGLIGTGIKGYAAYNGKGSVAV